MKMLIDKKVWDLPDGEVKDVRDMMVRNVWAEAEYDFKFQVPYGRCTKMLVEYLEDAFNNRRTVKMTTLLGSDQEVKLKCEIQRVVMFDVDKTFNYECVVLGRVKTKQLIDWSKVENE